MPVEVKGTHMAHVIAFARAGSEDAFLTIAPRLLTSIVNEREPPLDDVWADTELVMPDNLKKRVWKNEITGEVIESGRTMPVRAALKSFPVALISGKIRQESLWNSILIEKAKSVD